MFENFSEGARRAIIIARSEAEKYQHDSLTTAHLLLGIIKEGTGLAIVVLERLGVDINYLKQEIEHRIPYGRRGFIVGTIPFGPDAKKALEYAEKESRDFGHDYIGTEHLLLGIVLEKTGLGGKILRRLGIEAEDLRNEINEVTGEQIFSKREKTKKTPVLDEFGVDLTRLAKEGKLDPVIGRDREIERVIQILCRKKKNNPVLIGEPGVGKTAIVEGLAQRIVARDVPEPLLNARIIAIDLGAIVAGTKYRGQFESRMKAIIKEAASSEDIILFIDEIHTLVGAGAAEGSVDAANMLKPSLARGEIKVIGATTLSEYRKYIEKDGALERRFQTVFVEPPSKEDTVLILKGIKKRYEEYHKVEITDEAIEAAVRLADRYITSKFLPDKAIDLLDEACSMVKVRNYILPESIREVELELDRIDEEKRKAMEDQDLERVSYLREEEAKLVRRLRELRREWRMDREEDRLVVTAEDVAIVASKVTGIPLARISESEEKKLLSLEEEVKKFVVGQDEAVEKIAKAIKRSRAGLRVVNRPIGVFFFLGPTGVGKTRTAEVLAELLFGTRDALIRIDMSEYMERFNVSRLIGAPPGYVGYEEGGQLTEAVRRRPYSVVLFDEIEKAHPDVFNLLLQIFDSGRLTDAYGRVVDFRNTVIIMTSNIGAKHFYKNISLGFKDERSDFDTIKSNVLAEFRRRFPPEFINRVDEVIVFNPLTRDHMFDILDILLEEIKGMVREKGYELEVTGKAKAFIVDKGYSTQFGARPLRRVIDKYLIDPLSEEILSGRFPHGVTIVADLGTDGLRFRRKTTRKEAPV